MAFLEEEIASHVPQEGMSAVRLHGGSWDGKEVYVRNSQIPLIRVNGPRHGQHSVWIMHFYQRNRDRYEFVRTDVIPLSAWRLDLGGSRGGNSSAKP